LNDWRLGNKSRSLEAKLKEEDAAADYSNKLSTVVAKNNGGIHTIPEWIGLARPRVTLLGAGQAAWLIGGAGFIVGQQQRALPSTAVLLPLVAHRSSLSNTLMAARAIGRLEASQGEGEKKPFDGH